MFVSNKKQTQRTADCVWENRTLLGLWWEGGGWLRKLRRCSGKRRRESSTVEFLKWCDIFVYILVADFTVGSLTHSWDICELNRKVWRLGAHSNSDHPVHILNRSNVNLSWNGRRLVVGESLKGQVLWSFFMHNTSLIYVDLLFPRRSSVVLSFPRGRKTLEKASIMIVFFLYENHDRATLPYRCPIVAQML